MKTWETMHFLDREIEIEVVDKECFIKIMKQDKFWNGILEDKNSSFNQLLNIDGFLNYQPYNDSKSVSIADTDDSSPTTIAESSTTITSSPTLIKKHFKLKSPTFVNLFNLKVFALLMCLGNPDTKVDLLFKLAMGRYYQAEVNNLI